MQIWSTELKELETLYPSIKDRFPELEKELKQLLETTDANVLLIYSRRCLEVIVTDLCEHELKRPRKTEPLKGIIDKLGHEDKVPSHIIISMQYLNSLSTFGAHPKDFDPEQLKPVLSNLAIIIKWYLKYREEKVKAEEENSSGFQVPGSRFMSSGEGVKGAQEEVRGTKEEVQGTGYKVQGIKSRKNPFVIVSGVLIIAIILYIILDQFNFFGRDKFKDIKDPDGKISIAVMPFDNLTGDTTLNWFQRGISSLIINGLGNSNELAVCDDQTLFETMEGMNQVYTAGISPAQAKEIAKKVNAETYISGSLQGREGTYRIMANLVSTENGKIIWTDKVEGNLNSYLDLADSLCNELKNYLEIKSLENIADFDFREVYPNSAEAYRYFIEGMNLVLNQNLESGIQSLKKAVEIDSTFTFASFYLAYAYNSMFPSSEDQILWLKKAYNNKDRIPQKFQLWVDMWYACMFGTSMNDVGRYCDLLEESGINTRLFWFDLGNTYHDYLRQYEKAVFAYDMVMEINRERGSNWKFEAFYDTYGDALHKIEKHEQEKELYETGLNIFPKSGRILFRQIVCALSLGDSTLVNEYFSKLKILNKEWRASESTIERVKGQAYEEAGILDQAEIHYRRALQLKPQNTEDRINYLAGFLLLNNIDADEGMELVNKLLDFQPENFWYQGLKGIAYYRQGKYEEAIKLLSGVQERMGVNPYIENYLSEAKQALANQR